MVPLDRWWIVERKKGSSSVYRGKTGSRMSIGRRFMWLLIESFSLDRAAYFLPFLKRSLRRDPSFSLSLALSFPLCHSSFSLSASSDDGFFSFESTANVAANAREISAVDRAAGLVSAAATQKIAFGLR